MSGRPEDDMHLPPGIEPELDRRLGVWAAARRLGPDDLERIRAQVLARVSTEGVSTDQIDESSFDPEWLWSLLRPVSALMDTSVEDKLSDRIERWLQPLTGGRAYRSYLRLA
jgi:hypothetical protein